MTDTATITPTVTPPPIAANDDSDVVIPGDSSTFTILSGTPLAVGEELDPTSVCLIDPSTFSLVTLCVTTLEIDGEGVWTVDPVTGDITFTADDDVDPGVQTPVTYRVTDITGQTATATLTVRLRHTTNNFNFV
jgi:hypothetical protein